MSEDNDFLEYFENLPDIVDVPLTKDEIIISLRRDLEAIIEAYDEGSKEKLHEVILTLNLRALIQPLNETV
jgi:hypothetical protein